VREKATRRLLDIGEPAAAALQRATDGNADAELVARGQRLLREIERSRKLTPTRITLDHVDAPVTEIVDDLFRQAQIPPGRQWTRLRDNLEGQTATVRVDGVPLWDALKIVLPACGLQVVPQNQSLDLQPGDGAWPDYPSFSGEGVYLEVRSLQFNRSGNIDLANGPMNVSSNASLQMWLFTDPKLQTTGSVGLSLTRVEGTDGREMTARDSNRWNNGNSGPVRLVTAQIDLGDTLPRGIGVVEGELVLDVAVDSLEITVDDPIGAEPKAVSVGEQAYTIHPVQRSDERRLAVEIELTGRNIHHNEVQSALVNVRLEDAEGRRVPGQIAQFNHRDGNAVVTLNFRAEQEFTPTRLVWPVVTETDQQRIQFRVTDIELPEALRGI
jgi:hypothetical protein